ncbi:MAG: CRISPR-associated endonuclease Cas1, partial [Gemmataceae bacterium]
MPLRVTSISTPIAHLVGPGKIKIINGRLAFTTGRESPTRLDPAALRTLLCYGGVGVTDEAMSVLLRHGVEVAWLTAGGHRCHGRLVGTHADKTALRIVQHQVLADQRHKLELAKTVVVEKIESQMAAARHAQRHGTSAAGTVLRRLKSALDNCRGARDLDVIRGIEGGATAAWFSLFGNLLKAPWTFTQRVRRPPTDPVNALLSLGYTCLLSRTATRCEALGLEVALGALHEFRHGRPSLACDLIEPLRIPAVDRWVIALCNEGRIAVGDFLESETAGIRLQQEVFPRVLADWEKHWMSSGIEALLHQNVEGFIQRIRRLANLPSLDGMAVDREGLGNGASSDQT